MDRTTSSGQKVSPAALRAARAAFDAVETWTESVRTRLDYDDEIEAIALRIQEEMGHPADPTRAAFKPNELRTAEAGLLELACTSARHGRQELHNLAKRFRDLADAGNAVILGTEPSSPEVAALLDARFEVANIAGEARGDLRGAAECLRTANDDEGAEAIEDIIDALDRWGKASDAFLAKQGALIRGEGVD